MLEQLASLTPPLSRVERKDRSTDRFYPSPSTYGVQERVSE